MPDDYLIYNGKATLVRANIQSVGGNLPHAIGPYPTYPYPVVAIGEHAFRGCTRVEWLGLPGTVVSIHPTALSDCPNLNNITVSSTSRTYSSVGRVLYNKTQTIMLRCPEGFSGPCVLPASVRSIGSYAFQNCRALDWVGLPASLRTMGDYAFRGCSGLKSLRVPATVAGLGSGAFADCANLKGVLFKGNAPGYLHPGGERGMFSSESRTTVYVPQGSTGWDATFCGRPIVRYPALDAYEGDDSAWTAAAIYNGQTQTRSLHATGDVDWVKFTVDGAGARNVRIEITGDIEAQMKMWLYGPDDPDLYLDDGDVEGFFARLERAALAPGTYWLKIFSNSADPIPHYRLTAGWNSPGGDAYEPDNFASAAKALSNGQTQNRNIHAAGNEDWAMFTVGGAGARNVVVETAGASGDTQLWLYNRNGTQLAYDDNSGAGSFSRIAVAALPPGTYFIKVREYNNDGMIAAYTLRAGWTAVPSGGDAYEPDNSAGAAKAIANGQTQVRSIHAAGDADWVKFAVGGRGARNVWLETSGSRGDTQLWLYRSNGSEVARDDDSGAGSFSRIQIPALAPGTYYLKVQEYGNNGPLPAYALRAVWSTATVSVDAHEPDNGPATANAIANGQTQRRSIHAAGDTDWVRFDLAWGDGWTGASYTLRLETSGASGDTQMWLYGPDSASMGVAYDDNSGPGNFSRISVESLQWGTYYVKIQEKGNNGTIPAYTLRATWSH